MKEKLFIALIAVISFGCSLFPPAYELDNGDGIHFVWEEGLNDDERFRLIKDPNGYYHFPLYTTSQNIQRLSVKLLRGGSVVYDKANGYRHNLEWSSNLYWWLHAGDTVANITKTYFNPFIGQIQYVNLPPLINWKDSLIPTINTTSITDDVTGLSNTVIAPIGAMKGDTLVVSVKYTHTITRKEEGSMFISLLGSRIVKDSVSIVLD